MIPRLIATELMPGDLAELVPQPEQSGPADTSEARARALIEAGPAYAFRRTADGVLVFTGGLAELGGGQALAWTRIASIATREMALVTRMVRAVIDAADYRRTIMHVRSGFAAGHRWALHLGFEREGTMREHEPGIDFDLYARLRKEG